MWVYSAIVPDQSKHLVSVDPLTHPTMTQTHMASTICSHWLSFSLPFQICDRGMPTRVFGQLLRISYCRTQVPRNMLQAE